MKKRKHPVKATEETTKSVDFNAWQREVLQVPLKKIDFFGHNARYTHIWMKKKRFRKCSNLIPILRLLLQKIPFARRFHKYYTFSMNTLQGKELNLH